MKRSLSVICLFIATLFWVAIIVVPHHHHNGVLIFVSDTSHSDCNHSPCNDSDNDKCCNNNCEECPFYKNSDSIIKKVYDDSDAKAKFTQTNLFDIYNNHKYDFISLWSIIVYNNAIFKTTAHTQCSLLRAPPLA